MATLEDTMRCPHCRGDMLIVTYMYNNEQDRECCLCGVEQKLRYNPRTHSRYIMWQYRPRALIFLERNDGTYSYIQINQTKRVYRTVKAWMKRVYARPDLYNIAKCYGTVWNPKRKKLEIVFGKDLPIYDDAYYSDHDCWF